MRSVKLATQVLQCVFSFACVRKRTRPSFPAGEPHYISFGSWDTPKVVCVLTAIPNVAGRLVPCQNLDLILIVLWRCQDETGDKPKSSTSVGKKECCWWKQIWSSFQGVVLLLLTHLSQDEEVSGTWSVCPVTYSWTGDWSFVLATSIWSKSSSLWVSTPREKEFGKGAKMNVNGNTCVLLLPNQMFLSLCQSLLNSNWVELFPVGNGILSPTVIRAVSADVSAVRKISHATSE